MYAIRSYYASVGEDKTTMYKMVEDGIRYLPTDKPRYLMGVGDVITSYSIHYTKLYEDVLCLGVVLMVLSILVIGHLLLALTLIISSG